MYIHKHYQLAVVLYTQDPLTFLSYNLPKTLTFPPLTWQVDLADSRTWTWSSFQSEVLWVLLVYTFTFIWPIHEQDNYYFVVGGALTYPLITRMIVMIELCQSGGKGKRTGDKCFANTSFWSNIWQVYKKLYFILYPILNENTTRVKEDYCKLYTKTKVKWLIHVILNIK